MRRFRFCAAVIALALVMTALGLADVVTTTDGSRIVGTVEKVAGGKLIIMTDIAGRLESDAPKVTGIATSRAPRTAALPTFTIRSGGTGARKPISIALWAST